MRQFRPLNLLVIKDPRAFAFVPFVRGDIDEITCHSLTVAVCNLMRKLFGCAIMLSIQNSPYVFTDVVFVADRVNLVVNLNRYDNCH